jgi:hypothetical protein
MARSINWQSAPPRGDYGKQHVAYIRFKEEELSCCDKHLTRKKSLEMEHKLSMKPME